MTAHAFRRAVTKPYYFREIITQMDTVGVGSLLIITLTGGFTGGILALNTAPTLKTFGATGVTGQLVMTSLVREMAPVLASLMTAGRVGSAGRVQDADRPAHDRDGHAHGRATALLATTQHRARVEVLAVFEDLDVRPPRRHALTGVVDVAAGRHHRAGGRPVRR